MSKPDYIIQLWFSVKPGENPVIAEVTNNNYAPDSAHIVGAKSVPAILRKVADWIEEN